MTRGRRLRLVAVAVAAVTSSTLTIGLTRTRERPVLPDTEPVEFSLDLEVVATTDAPVVYAVEQRARPNYRVLALDPTDGAVATVWSVPEGAIVHGIDLDPTGDVLAIAYAPTLDTGGNGIATLDLASGELVEVTPPVEDVHLVDLEWSEDGSALLATRVDRAGEQLSLSVARVDVASGEVETVVDGGVDPAASGGLVHYLAVDPDTGARTSVRALDPTSGDDVALAHGELDLDHVVADDDELLVAGIVDEAAVGLTIGAPAEAHGSHDLPSTWWDVGTASALGTPPTTTFDAELVDDHLVQVTRSGLTITTDGVDVWLVASRALRFVTA